MAPPRRKLQETVDDTLTPPHCPAARSADRQKRWSRGEESVSCATAIIRSPSRRALNPNFDPPSG